MHDVRGQQPHGHRRADHLRLPSVGGDDAAPRPAVRVRVTGVEPAAQVERVGRRPEVDDVARGVAHLVLVLDAADGSFVGLQERPQLGRTSVGCTVRVMRR